jgi:hypothetical protein
MMQAFDPVIQQTAPMYEKLPSPDNLKLPPQDAVWFELFTKRMDEWDAVPRFIKEFLARLVVMSLDHYALRQSIMAQAAGYYALVTRTTMEHSQRFLLQLLPQVQLAISRLDIDELHICTVFQLAKTSCQMADVEAAHRHLKGLYVMIDHVLAKRKEPTPLLMCAWRGGVYLDTRLAFEGQPFAFPSPRRKRDVMHRKWLTNFIPRHRQYLVDFALAQFELDNIEHCVMRLLGSRESAEFDPDKDVRVLCQRGEALLLELEQWIQQAVIIKHEMEEDIGRLLLDNLPQKKFLHHPPLNFQSENYALILLSYHSITILTTLLTHPNVGAKPPKRYTSAITICRIYAYIMSIHEAENREPSHWHGHDLFRAGLALGEDLFPMGSTRLNTLTLEFKWIVDRLREMTFPYAVRMADILEEVWQNRGSVLPIYGQLKQ